MGILLIEENCLCGLQIQGAPGNWVELRAELVEGAGGNMPLPGLPFLGGILEILLLFFLYNRVKTLVSNESF